MIASDIVQAEVVVMPIRFTDQVPRMQEFLTLLGFSPRLSRAESWVDMAGGSGMVALHAAALSSSSAGDTGLNFEVADLEVLAAQFARAGYVDMEIYDETYGRAVNVRDQHGTQLTFNERPTDLYGYRLDEPRPEHGIVSMPLRFDPPAGPFGQFLSAAGFVRLDEGDDEWWRVWRSNGGGLVALHPSADHRAPGSVQFGFRTREPLDALAGRLKAGGYADVAVSGEFGGELTVTDPDDQVVLVQSVPNDTPLS
jgi:hypothetical protein